MDKIREHIYLAALLHDIGKFYQRADSGSVSTSSFLSPQNKVESSFLPLSMNGTYTHKHCLWTAQFIDKHRSVFQKLMQDDSSNLSDKDNLINIAACHHLKANQLSDLGKIIKEADCLSSGMDRDSDDALKDDQDEGSWNSFMKKRMISILQTIGADSMTKEWLHLPIEKLSLSKKTFPKETFESTPDYKKLWEEFELDFKFIQADNYHAFSETLLNLLSRYTVSIPSSTINFPDVSLYDHLKTTASLAICLYDYYKEKEKTNVPFLLIGADISGIQSYIYQIVSKYAGKNLKGRSFYLHLLSDTIVRFLLNKLNLFQANVVYNSGGSFYILAPNTSFIKRNLTESIDIIEKHLFKVHGISLFVAIDSIEISKDTLLHKGGFDLGQSWGELFAKRDKKKSKRFASLINANYQQFFTPIMQGGKTERDVITGEEFLPDEKPAHSSLRIKKTTYEQIELGRVLRESEVMIVSEEIIPYWTDKFWINPIELGLYYYFLKQKDLEEMKVQLRASADKVTVIILNGKEGDCDFMCKLNGVNNIYGLEFYGGNAFNGHTFENMCQNNHFSRLGILRMDVDGLGSIFQHGLSQERATLSRYAALSRSFDFFFSGYLNTIWREVNPDKSFIVYSGGDDVFIVGSWEVTIQLANRIRKDFELFASANNVFSISGGIAIIPADFPIMKGAEESAQEEDNAKKHTCCGFNKNSVSFMSMPLNWQMEYPIVETLKNSIAQLIKKEMLPKSFISKVLLHAANAKIKEHSITFMKTFWMMTYDLSRLQERYKSGETKSLINNCIAEVCGNKKQLNGQTIKTDYHALELWAFASRWAELEIRKDKE